MVQLLTIREHLKNFISKYEGYVRPASKFLLCLVTFIIINSKIGFAVKLANFALAIIISLAASYMPTNFIIVVAALASLLHLYAVSIECVIVVGLLYALMFLLFFRFSPKDTLLLLFTPICFVLKIPYVTPLAAGLVSSAASVVSIGCGTVTYYILSFIATNKSSFVGMDNETVVVKMRYLLDEILYNKEMLMMVIAFTATIIVVNIIRRLSVDHAWTIAIITGTLTDILIVLIGDLKYGTYISVPGLIIGSIVAVLVVIVIKFFVFNVDYSRTERVQFEDDEYYYYVKAVPKNTVAITDKQVKRIKGQPKPGNTPRRAQERARGDNSRDAAIYRVKRSGTTRNSGNKNAARRVIMPDETIRDGKIVRNRSLGDEANMTDIERAASAKAREMRARREKK